MTQDEKEGQKETEGRVEISPATLSRGMFLFYKQYEGYKKRKYLNF